MATPASASTATAGHKHPNNAAIAEESAAIYPDTNPGRPTPEEIAVEAYHIYRERGASDGQDMDDWLEAERRLSALRNQK
jgi:DUF2934 family protein